MFDQNILPDMQVLFRNLQRGSQNGDKDIGLLQGLPPGTPFTTSKSAERAYLKVRRPAEAERLLLL